MLFFRTFSIKMEKIRHLGKKKNEFFLFCSRFFVSLSALKLTTMKKVLFWALTALVTVSCGSKSAKVGDSADSVTMTSDTALADGYVPQRSDYTFRTDVRTINDEGEVRWDTIVVYLTDAKGRTRQLYSQAQPLDTMMWDKRSIGLIEEEDWNFDGIPDLQVSMGPTNGSGNVTYDVWLWDDKAHRFVYLETPAEIVDPSVDTAHQTIVSTWRLDDEVEIIRYKWKDGQLVESEREQLTRDELAGD